MIMKKIILLLLLLSITFSVKAQFPEGFETAVPPAGWASFIGTNGEGIAEDWGVDTTLPVTGLQSAYVSYENSGFTNEDWLVTPQFTPSAAANILTFQQTQDFSSDYGTTYTVRVSTLASQTTHADFAIVDTQFETDFTPGIYSAHNVDLSAYNGTPIYVAFVMEQADGDSWYIDDVDLIVLATAPVCAENPTPSIAAIDVVVTDGAVTIAWDAPSTGDAPTSYEIFWGTTSGALVSIGLLSSTTINVTVAYSTEYFWSIIPSNSGGAPASCTEWSFTTEAAPPAPANDECANATLVDGGLPYKNTQDANSATNNAGFIAECGGMNDGVWYKFTVATSGTVDIVTSSVSAGFDQELAIYSGSCGAFVCVDSADDTFAGTGEALTAVAVTAGTEYFVNIGYWSGSTDNPEGSFTIDITTSDTTVLPVNDNTIEGFSLYPNPVNDRLHLNALDTINDISIYNLLGQEVMNSRPEVSNTEVDMSNLPTGMYVVKVKVGEQLGTYRIVKE
jgi:hypothetical protein